MRARQERWVYCQVCRSSFRRFVVPHSPVYACQCGNPLPVDCGAGREGERKANSFLRHRKRPDYGLMGMFRLPL